MFSKNFNNCYFSFLSLIPFFSSSFYFIFYLYISFLFTYTMLGRGLRGQWLLLSQVLPTTKRVFIYFIHLFIFHTMWVVELRDTGSRTHYFRTLIVFKKSFYHIHEGRWGPSLVLYIVFIPNGKEHMTKWYSGNVQLQCNKCVGAEPESLWHLTEYQWNCYAQLRSGLCKITSQKMNDNISTAMKW